MKLNDFLKYRVQYKFNTIYNSLAPSDRNDDLNYIMKTYFNAYSSNVQFFIGYAYVEDEGLLTLTLDIDVVQDGMYVTVGQYYFSPIYNTDYNKLLSYEKDLINYLNYYSKVLKRNFMIDKLTA